MELWSGVGSGQRLQGPGRPAGNGHLRALGVGVGNPAPSLSGSRSLCDQLLALHSLLLTPSPTPTRDTLLHVVIQLSSAQGEFQKMALLSLKEGR